MVINNKATKILDAALAGGYAVPAMCCYNLEGVLATVHACEAKRSPGMVLLFPWAIRQFGPLLVHAAAEACRNANVPVTLHMDHAQDPEIIKKAADIGGFDSIMVDMSHYEKDENLRLTKELTEYLHERGIATEAEPGRIEGGEDGVSDTADLEGVLTTPEEAEKFVATGIDWLAPAFGNVHGSYGPRGIHLEYDRLESINKAVGDRVRLVAHGCDPWTPEHFSKCISLGVSKINVNKVMNNEFTGVLEGAEGKLGIMAVVEQGTAGMQRAVEKCCDWFGSSGKA